MILAMVGLGKMGGNMARRLSSGGHRVVGFNRSFDVTQRLASTAGLLPARSLEEAVSLLGDKPEAPRIVWCMLPAGEVTEQALSSLSTLLKSGDVLIDGGNSNFKETMRRARMLGEKDLHFLDVGVSGGIWGLKEGYSMMIGGDGEVVARLRPVFETLAPAPDLGWGHVGPHGSGHFVKMVHNGIEYGMMEALAEGFELMKARQDFNLDLHQVAQIWRDGSVVRSWLLDLAERALDGDPELSEVLPWVEDSGEGRWTVMEAIENSVPAPVIALSLFRRFASRQEQSYAAKLLAALRNQFGGHEVKRGEN